MHLFILDFPVSVKVNTLRLLLEDSCGLFLSKNCFCIKVQSFFTLHKLSKAIILLLLVKLRDLSISEWVCSIVGYSELNRMLDTFMKGGLVF